MRGFQRTEAIIEEKIISKLQLKKKKEKIVIRFAYFVLQWFFSIPFPLNDCLEFRSKRLALSLSLCVFLNLSLCFYFCFCFVFLSPCLHFFPLFVFLPFWLFCLFVSFSLCVLLNLSLHVYYNLPLFVFLSLCL